MTPLSPTSVQQWRAVATDFHGVRWCLSQGSLRPDFEPIDLARLRKTTISPALRGIFSFLLQVWNRSNRFDLAEIQRWDADHIGAFVRWANGSTQRPCHYF